MSENCYPNYFKIKERHLNIYERTPCTLGTKDVHGVYTHIHPSPSPSPLYMGIKTINMKMTIMVTEKRVFLRFFSAFLTSLDYIFTIKYFPFYFYLITLLSLLPLQYHPPPCQLLNCYQIIYITHLPAECNFPSLNFCLIFVIYYLPLLFLEVFIFSNIDHKYLSQRLCPKHP